MIVWNNEHYRLWTTEAFWFYSFPPVEEAQMNSGETSVMYESSIFCCGVDIYLFILVVRMTIDINRSFLKYPWPDRQFWKRNKNNNTKISDAIPALAADNCILFLLKLLLHKVVILLYQMVLIASLD